MKILGFIMIIICYLNIKRYIYMNKKYKNFKKEYDNFDMEHYGFKTR
jgi:hypothetical protein